MHLSTFSHRGLLPGMALVLALSACSGGEEATIPEPRTVLATAVQSASHGERRFSGMLRAAERSDLAFEVSGPITTIAVELGDRVSQGQTVARLDDRPYQLDLDARRANLLTAEAELSDARRDYDRRAALDGTGAVSRSAIDQAITRLERAEAQVAALMADVKNAEERLSDTVLTAPFNGEITARLAEPAEVVTAGRTVLRMIGENRDIEAIVFVPGEVRQRLDVTAPVQIARSGDATSVPGQITEIGAAANLAGLFPITVQIGADATSFRPGESVEATVAERFSAAHVLIPITAYVPEGQGIGRVYVIDRKPESAIVVARQIRIAALRRDGVVVSEGLRAGDLVAAKGVEFLTDGQTVRTAGVGLAQYNH